MSEPDPFTQPFPEPKPELAPAPEPERPHVSVYRRPRRRPRRAGAFAFGLVVGAAATWLVVLIATYLGHSP